MEPTDARITGVERKADEIKQRVERLATNQSGNQNVTSVNNTGDRSVVWIMVALTALVLGMNLAQLNQISELRTQVRRLEDYQMTTFMLVPELRKEVERVINQRKEKK